MGVPRLPTRASGTGKNLKVGAEFFGRALHFLALKVQLVVLVSAFVMVCTVWPVSCLLSILAVPPCPMESAPLTGALPLDPTVKLPSPIPPRPAPTKWTPSIVKSWVHLWLPHGGRTQNTILKHTTIKPKKDYKWLAMNFTLKTFPYHNFRHTLTVLYCVQTVFWFLC